MRHQEVTWLRRGAVLESEARVQGRSRAGLEVIAAVDWMAVNRKELSRAEIGGRLVCCFGRRDLTRWQRFRLAWQIFWL